MVTSGNKKIFADVILIRIDSPGIEDARREPPLGLMYLSAFLNRYGVKSQILDITFEECLNGSESIPHASVYGISTYTDSYHLAYHLAINLYKQNPSACIVAGGPHASAIPGEVLADGFDYVIAGEGEHEFSKLVMEVLNGTREKPFIRKDTHSWNLDKYPFPEYNGVDLNSYTRRIEGKICASILTSRGCPYKCVFCNSNVMGSHIPVRLRSAANIVSEIKMLISRFGVEAIRFQDDLFTIDHTRIHELAVALKPLDIWYRCFSRVNNFDTKMAHMLAESGCRHVSFGVESGSKAILKAMHKNQTPDQIKHALICANKAGLATRIFLIAGFPGETDATIQETLDLLQECPFDEFSVYPLICYPGTKLWREPEKYGIKKIKHNYPDYIQAGRLKNGYPYAGFTIWTDSFGPDNVREWRNKIIDVLLNDGRKWAGNSKKFV